jgi:hypothetical protein
MVAVVFALTGAAAAESSYAAVMRVTFPGVEVRLANTERWLPLAAGSQAPLGQGDSVRTDRTGRVLLRFLDSVEMLLLPGSVFELVTLDAAPTVQLVARLHDGHLVQRLVDDANPGSYRLETDAFTLVEPARSSGVWARAEQPAYITVTDGEAVILQDDAALAVAEGEGLRFSGATADRLMFDAPLNAPRLEGLLRGCAGVITTLDGRNLNIRVAPNFGDTLLGSIPHETPVEIMGVTEFGEWYRIQVLSVFAWVESPAVETTCADLPILPYLSVERNNSILAVLPDELPLLQPFYGLPADDTLFYLNLREG